MRSSIRYKLLFVFIFVIMILVIISSWAVYNFGRLSGSIDNIMISNYKSIEAAQQMAVSVERQDSIELSMLLLNNENDVTDFKSSEAEFLKNLAAASDNITEKNEGNIIKNLDENYMEYLKLYENFRVQLIQNNHEEARNMYMNKILPMFEKVKENIRELQLVNHKGMLNRKDNAKYDSEKAVFSTLFISAVSIIFSLAAMLMVINSILNPIHNLIKQMKKVAQRNYDIKIDLKRKDEIGELGAEFSKMTEKISEYDMMNVDELKNEKQKAEAIVETIEDGIIVTNNECKLLLVNKSAEKIFAIEEANIINHHILEIIKNEYLFHSVKNALLEEKNEYIDISIENGNEEVSYYRVYSKLISRNNENIGVVTLLQNITKFKETDRLKSDFLAIASHELKTPLTSIIMSIDMLLRDLTGKVDEENLELLKIIEEESNRLRNLVNDLLNLEKIESGKDPLIMQEYDLNILIDRVTERFKVQFDELKIKFIKNTSENLQSWSDIGKIDLVLSNLISNAVKFVKHDGSGEIILTVEEKNDKILVSVADNGIGISSSQQAGIFNKFQKIRESVNDIQKGSGLGLSVCKEIIKAHKNNIWVESEEDKGTKFYFTLDKKSN